MGRRPIPGRRVLVVVPLGGPRGILLSSCVHTLKVPDGLGDGAAVDLGGERELVADTRLQTVEAEAVLPRRIQGGLLDLADVTGVEQLELLALHPGGVGVVDDGLDGRLRLRRDLHGVF